MSESKLWELCEDCGDESVLLPNTVCLDCLYKREQLLNARTPKAIQILPSWITWHVSTRFPGQLFTVEYVGSFIHNPYRVRFYDRNVLATDTGYTTEVRAREEFERKVEAHYNE